MKMKKIVSSLLALSMILFMTCITVFADNETNVSEQCSFVYTDKTISSNYDIATVALDQYEPNDFDKPYILGGIKSKSKPIITVNASLSMIDGDILDGYEVGAYTYEAEKNEKVEELVVLLGNLSYGDRLVMIILDNDNNEVASGVIDGRKTSGAYVSFPVDAIGSYRICIALADFENKTDDNTEVNYTLQIASRYVRDTQTYYASPSTLHNKGRDSYSSAATVVIKETDVPSSAIVDVIFNSGMLTNDKTGIVGICIMKMVNGSKELYNEGPVGFLKNLTSRNIPLAGTWKISYLPGWDDPSTLTNLSITFDYTYDILDL